MDEGRVVADGLTEDLMSNSELLEAHGLEMPMVKSNKLAAEDGGENE
jgi:hypothetical protein